MMEIVGTEDEFVRQDLGPETVPENPQVYDDLVKYCMDLYKEFEDSTYRKAKLEEIRASRNAYSLIEDPATSLWEGASNEVLPLTAITVDNLEPRVVNGLVGRNPIISFAMKGIADKPEPVRMVENFFHQELKDEVGIDSVVRALVHTILLEGTWYPVVEYDREKVTQKDFQFDDQGNVMIDPATKRPIIVDVKATKFDGCKVSSVPFSDILCADDIGTPEEWEVADKIRKIRPTYGEIMRCKGKFGYLDDMIGPWLYDQTITEKAEEDKSPAEQVAGVAVHGKKVIESAEFHISYPIYRDTNKDWREQENFQEEQIIVTIALKAKRIYRIVYRKELAFKNDSLIGRVRLFPEEGQSYGTSVYGKIKGLQAGGSEVFNSIINAFQVAMLGGGFYQEGAGLSGTIKKAPGEYLPVEDVSKIKDSVLKLNPAAFVGIFNTILELWERAGSISNPQIGRPDSKEKTATEIMVVIQEGNAKFDYQAQTTQAEFIRLLQTIYNLYYQYLPLDYQFIYNGKPTLLPRSLMKQDFQFSLSGTTATANKAIERKEAEDLYQIGVNNPLMNALAITEDVLKTYGKLDMEKYINPQISQLVKAFMTDPQGISAAIQQYITTRDQIAAEAESKSRPQVGGVGGV